MTAVFAAPYNARMLKIFVISLFVANVLLFGFEASKPPAKKVAARTAPQRQNSNIPTIHLFSELMENRDLMAGNRQCFTLGPFHSNDEMYAVYARLAPVSISIQNRETLAMVEKGYWVFMPPYKSFLEANEELLSLQALGLEDIGIIYEGQRKNSISLGYFLRQKNAMKRKQGLESRGYEPLMRVQRQAEPRYWLDYEQDPGSGLIDLDMQNRPNDFMQRVSPCAEKPLFEANAMEFELPAESDEAERAQAIDESDALESDKG